MERNELLEKLHCITFTASITDLTSEYCLEVVVLTGDGVDYSWMGYDDWNYYFLNGIDQERWQSIREKLLSGSLSKDDVADTDLALLIGDRCEEEGFDYCVFLESLKKFSAIFPEEFYCELNNGTPVFYETEEEFALAQKTAYKSCVRLWDEMDTEELEEWLEVYECNEGIPYYRFDE